MWQDLGGAIALLLVIEGIMPFISPATLRRALTGMLEMNDQMLRLAGLSSMILGVMLLYLIR